MNTEPKETIPANLEKIRFGIYHKVSQELLEAKVDLSEQSNFLEDLIIVRVRGFVWGESLDPILTKYPADWWQAFKERWFPAWALRAWPIRYEVLRFDVKAMYPNFRPSLPDQDYAIVYQRKGRDA